MTPTMGWSPIPCDLFNGTELVMVPIGVEQRVEAHIYTRQHSACHPLGNGFAHWNGGPHV